jgi:hypothetical protein
MAQVQIHSISHRHEAIADWLLANPHETNLQKLANEMNVSRSWLSIIMQSDVFKEYFARRRAEWAGSIRERIHDAQAKVTLEALRKLENIVADDETEDRLIFDIANRTAQNLGFGVKNKSTVTEEVVQEVTRSVDSQTLANARETFRRITSTTYVLPAPEST